jgi:hypothetical protein
LPQGEPVSFCFKGDGKDANESFEASGYFNPLPPQHGISGWHRMTMMKYWQDENGIIDESSLWAYEGVVLPGGMVMLGRVTSPFHTQHSHTTRLETKQIYHDSYDHNDIFLSFCSGIETASTACVYVLLLWNTIF